jgi:K(+)-stimulated pyrophosphate-energized sodium pump
VSGVLMGMFQNNAGGAWDNAKKSFEKGVDINGQIYYKKSEPHKASVTGDTVGDPFKDTSGPSMNILIKLMSIVSLVVAPTLAQLHESDIKFEKKIENVEVSIINTDTTKADISITEGPDQGLMGALKADGLIPEGVEVAIKYENGKLTVNDTEIDAVKYQQYLKGDKMEIKITKD